MFVEGGWKPAEDPLPPKPRLTPGQERVLLWLVIVAAILLLVAPIGGATILEAPISWAKRG